jgi:hypothetical protein
MVDSDDVQQQSDVRVIQWEMQDYSGESIIYAQVETIERVVMKWVDKGKPQV